MKKKRNVKKLVSMLLFLVFLTACIEGCGKKETTSSETEQVTESNSSQVAETGKTSGLDNELSGSLKQKYASSENNKYQYAEPIYNVERDHVFVYEQVGSRCWEEDTMYDDIKVYIDGDFISPLYPDMEYDGDNQTLSILPQKGGQALRFISDEGFDDVDDDKRDWGNAPKYWIVQYNDLNTGEALAKPIVTLFTVKAEMDAPTVTFDVDEKGYARLSWKAVPGAESYRIYEMDESAEYGISLACPYLVGETTQTSFAEFDEKYDWYDPEEGVATQNVKFYDFGIKDEEAGLSEAYCVVAVSGNKHSNVSNLIYQKDVRNRLVTCLVYDYEEVGEEEADFERVQEKIADLPAFQLVQMADSSIVPIPIDYANATWKENEFGMASEGNLSIQIRAGIQGTDFKITMYAKEATESTIDSDLAALAERQKQLAGKCADVKPQNDIDYVPSSDSSDDAVPQDESKEVSEAEEATDETDEETVESEEPEAEADEETAESEESEAEADEETAESEDPGAETDEETAKSEDPEAETDEEIAESEETDDESTTEESATTEQTVNQRKDIEVTATSALSEYIATYMLCHEEAIDLSMFPEAGDSDYLVNAIMEAYNQNPLIGSLNRYGYDYDSSTLYLEYEYSKEEQAKMQEAVVAEAEKVVGEIITDGMSDVEKEFAINNYLCSTAEYDYGALENAESNNFEMVDHEFADSFTPYGVLLNKVGVCASYSGAFKVLADKADLDCYVVTGYLNGNLPHAWNRVSLDGQWVTVDATNNDNEKYENALLNIPDYMSSGLLVEDNTYLLSDTLASMTADKDENEFYRVENKYYSYDELETELVELLSQGESFTIRTDYTITEDEMMELIQTAMAKAQVPNAKVYLFLGVLTVEL